jgi:hypothetical protein
MVTQKIKIKKHYKLFYYAFLELTLKGGIGEMILNSTKPKNFNFTKEKKY